MLLWTPALSDAIWVFVKSLRCITFAPVLMLWLLPMLFLWAAAATSFYDTKDSIYQIISSVNGIKPSFFFQINNNEPLNQTKERYVHTLGNSAFS